MEQAVDENSDVERAELGAQRQTQLYERCVDYGVMGGYQLVRRQEVCLVRDCVGNLVYLQDLDFRIKHQCARIIDD